MSDSLQFQVSNSQNVSPSVGERPSTYAGAKTRSPEAGVLGLGSLANIFDTNNATAIDISSDYAWTTSKIYNRDDIPFIQLIEHRNEESLIKRQFAYYAQGIADTVGNIGDRSKSKGLLNVYDEIWPDNPTNWIYRFPYFNKTHFDLSTPNWSKVDKPGEALKGAASGASGALEKFGFKNISNVVNVAAAGIDAAAAAAELGLGFASPLVGTVDRPRIFTEHSERSIIIQFPLYNTLDANDWIKNRNFFYIFASQNLFNKRDFITGLPPVWYRVYVPGQYYSHASCVTNFNVENLGNTRLEYGGIIVPDAYQISITLTEMVMPSLNQFQAAVNGDANSRVTTAVRGAGATTTTSSDITNSANQIRNGSQQIGNRFVR